MSASDNDGTPEGSPRRGQDYKEPDPSTPDLDELDSSWGDGEELDSDATTVAKIPQELMALSRRRSAPKLQVAPPAPMPIPAARPEDPKKHEAITSRPPPMPSQTTTLPGGLKPVEGSVIVEVPHERLPALASQSIEIAQSDLEGDLGIDEAEEELAAEADVAAGLSEEARRRAMVERAATRKEKARAKALAAKEKRKARADAQKEKQKPKQRKAKKGASVPPPAQDRSERSDDSPSPDSTVKGVKIAAAPKRDFVRMAIVVAVVIALGALAIVLVKR